MALFGGSGDDVLPYVEELVEAAEGSTVTAEALSDTRLNDPVLTYLEEGEQPHHVLVARDSPIRANERGSVTTIAPEGDLRAVTVLTDERVLFLVGERSGDAARSVAYDDVYEFEVDAGLRRTRLEVTVRDARYTSYFSRFVDAGAVVDFLVRATGEASGGATGDANASEPGQTPAAVGEEPLEADPPQAAPAASLRPDQIEDALRTIDDRQFERFVADLWRARGWTATVTQGSADRGVDVVATREAPVPQKHVLQAKRYAADNPVGSPEIQQYASLHRQEGADAVVVVTTSEFTGQAERVADDLDVKLVDGEDLAGQVADAGRHDLLAAHGASLPDGIESERPDGAADPESSTDQARTDGSPAVPPAREPSSPGAGEVRVRGDSSSGLPIEPESAADAAADDLSVEEQSVIRSTGDSRGTYGSVLGHAVVAVLTAWWTLGIGNLAYASWAYHHATYPRPDVGDEAFDAAPSANWYYGIPAGLGLVAVSALVGVVELGPVAVAGLLVGWLLLPVATYLDVQYVRAETEWNPITGWWLLGVIVPPLAVVVVPLYLLRRYLAVRSLGRGGTDASGETE